MAVQVIDLYYLHRPPATNPIDESIGAMAELVADPETLGTTDVMRELGIGLVPYSPLGRGFFTAAVDVSTLHAGDMRRSNPRFANGAAEANQPMLNTVRSIAAAHGATPAQVSLAWVIVQSGRLGIPVVPIPGTKHAATLLNWPALRPGRGNLDSGRR